jgi:hypothetical protein
MLPGPGPCGTVAFGLAAADFTQALPDAGGYDGGVIEPGVYDAVFAERSSAARGSWRETFVVDAQGRFTRIRQIDTGTGNGPGPITYRSGTVSTTGAEVKLTYTCAVSGDAGVDASSDTLPFDTASDTCGTTQYRYGATGIRATLKRRL